MAAEFFAVVTDMGTKKMLEAVGEEKKVNIIDFAVGDGNGQYYTPDKNMTELKNEVWRGMVRSCKISQESENLLIIESIIPSDAGGFTIREMGIFDDEGTMIAVCNTPDTQKVKVTDGVVHELSLSMEIALSNTDSVQLTVDPSVIMATKKDLQILAGFINEQIENICRSIRQLTKSTEENRKMINMLFGLVCGYSFNREEKKITSFLPHRHADGKLEFPEGAAYRDGDKIVLAGAVQLPESGAGTGAGNVQEIAAAAAKMVQDSMEEISAEQARGLFGFTDNK